MAAMFSEAAAVEQVAMVCVGVCLEEKNLVEGLLQVTGVRKAATPSKGGGVTLSTSPSCWQA